MESMNKLMKAVEEKKFSEFAVSTRDILDKKLASHPIIRAKAEKIIKYKNMADTFSKIER